MKVINQRHIHPFPARMAPEIAIQVLADLGPDDLILDPMTGSGTVLHHAATQGIKSLGYDLDPLAILMSRVRTRKINFVKFNKLCDNILLDFENTKLKDVYLPWIDDSSETKNFISYWFGTKQANSLRKLSFLIQKYSAEYNINNPEIDAIKIALSRIIITKKIGASLAWDISHSRPHKVRNNNDYDVKQGFEASLKSTRKWLEQQTIVRKSKIILGDARYTGLADQSVDKVITSPPYLNAIDYMRGHKFSLIWLGYSIEELRNIRSNSIGVEKKIDSRGHENDIDAIFSKVLKSEILSQKHEGMIRRYIKDAISLMCEVARVLKRDKTATFVIGNSTLSGVYIENSKIFEYAGGIFKLEPIQEVIREIPLSKRYLPVPSCEKNSLSKRMKHEVILTFCNRQDLLS